MRDYTQIPGYEHMTQMQARYNYLHDLLEDWQELDKEDVKAGVGCRKREVTQNCLYCSFNGFLGGDREVCCNWRAEAEPDRAIDILESLLWGRGHAAAQTEQDAVDRSRNLAEYIAEVADYYGLESQMDILQEECGELVQSVSKMRRWGKDDENARRSMAEEMADVQFLLLQVSHLLGLSREVEIWLGVKVAKRLQIVRSEDSDHEAVHR